MKLFVSFNYPVPRFGRDKEYYESSLEFKRSIDLGKRCYGTFEFPNGELIECRWQMLAVFDVKLDSKEQEISAIYEYQKWDFPGYDEKNYKKLTDDELLVKFKNLMEYEKLNDINELKKFISKLSNPGFFGYFGELSRHGKLDS